MFLFMPEKTQKYRQKAKENYQIRLAKKAFKYYKRKGYDLVNPFNIKHLNYKGSQERYLEYFLQVNEAIRRTRTWASARVNSRNFYKRTYLSTIDVSENMTTIDGFNIMMKEKLGCPTAKEYYVKKKLKKQKYSACGEVKKCIYESLLW